MKIDEKYNAPKVVTSMPGPKSLKMMKEDYSKSQKLYTITTHFMVDMQKSYGNYLADIDGKKTNHILVIKKYNPKQMQSLIYF